MKSSIKIAFLGLVIFLFACHPEPRDAGQAARDALRNGYAYLETDNESAAMEAFKDAEHYGLLSGDSLMVSRARCEIGDMMYCKGETKEKYIGRLKAADAGFGTHFSERAKLWNLMASAYMAFKEFATRRSLSSFRISKSPAKRRPIILAPSSIWWIKSEEG